MCYAAPPLLHSCSKSTPREVRGHAPRAMNACFVTRLRTGTPMHSSACMHAGVQSLIPCFAQSAVQQPAHSWRACAAPPPFHQCDVLMLVGLPGGRHLTARMWHVLLMLCGGCRKLDLSYEMHMFGQCGASSCWLVCVVSGCAHGLDHVREHHEYVHATCPRQTGSTWLSRSHSCACHEPAQIWLHIAGQAAARRPGRRSTPRRARTSATWRWAPTPSWSRCGRAPRPLRSHRNCAHVAWGRCLRVLRFVP